MPPATRASATIRWSSTNRRMPNFDRIIDATLRGEMTSVGGHASVDGRPCWFHSEYIPDRETDGRVRGFYALTFDVTTQKTAERLAATSEHRLRLICDNAPAAVCYINEQRCYRYNNAA